MTTSPSSRGPAVGLASSTGNESTSVGSSLPRYSRLSARIRSSPTSSIARWPSRPAADTAASAAWRRSSVGASISITPRLLRLVVVLPAVVVAVAAYDVEFAVELHVGLAAVPARHLDLVIALLIADLRVGDAPTPGMRKRRVAGALQRRARDRLVRQVVLVVILTAVVLAADDAEGPVELDVRLAAVPARHLDLVIALLIADLRVGDAPAPGVLQSRVARALQGSTRDRLVRAVVAAAHVRRNGDRG